MVNKVLSIVMLLLLFSQYNWARDNDTCDIINGRPLANGYGPYDFTNPLHADKLPIVLGAHFTHDVERLVKGTTNSTPHGDIDYTLRAIPNYHRALYAASKLELRDKAALKKGESYRAQHFTAECYFKRAIYFQPNDAITHMLYGMHLHKLGKLSNAELQYKQALALDNKNVEIHYNAGLLYFDLKNIPKAKEHAQIAYEMGYPLNGLKTKLEKF